MNGLEAVGVSVGWVLSAAVWRDRVKDRWSEVRVSVQKKRQGEHKLTKKRGARRGKATREAIRELGGGTKNGSRRYVHERD